MTSSCPNRFSVLFPNAVVLVLVALLAWGCGEGNAGPNGRGDASAAAEEAPAAASSGRAGFRLPETEYPPAVVSALETALAAYDEIADLLARDRTEGLAPRARRLVGALELARTALAQDESAGDGSGATAAELAAEAARAARGLAETEDLDGARDAFSELSRFVIAVTAADPRLAGDREIYSCPMTDGFDKWMQPKGETGAGGEPANPFMGTAMTTCALPADWSVTPPSSVAELEAHSQHVHGGEEGEISHYTCSMHPSVKSPEPGSCPICNMELTPVYVEAAGGRSNGSAGPSGVVLSESRRQEIGVRTAPAEVRPLASEIRAVGRVTYDETRLADVSVKYEGWIGRLSVDETGERVRRGQTLFTLYSPDLFAAQQEYLAALSSQRRARETSVPQRADYLVEAARRKLALWDVPPGEIERLAETGEPIEYLPVSSPVSGYVVEKNVVAGAAVQPGMKLFRIADLSRVWIEAEIYESELPLVEEGDRAQVSLPYLPGESLTGRVTFVYPWLDRDTRTGRVRIELPNPGLRLKPDMYADVTLERDLGERLVIPEEAVLYAGEKQYVFVDEGDGRLVPRSVELGRTEGDWVEVLRGLDQGEEIVTSGNFLVAAESRLKTALEDWR